jgi:hypothetical protein
MYLVRTGLGRLDRGKDRVDERQNEREGENVREDRLEEQTRTGDAEDRGEDFVDEGRMGKDLKADRSWKQIRNGGGK